MRLFSWKVEKQKNYEELINLFEDSKFVINIVGSGSKKDKLVELAKQKNIKVNFLGRLKMKTFKKFTINTFFLFQHQN